MADVDFILKPIGDKIVVRPDKRILSSVIIVGNKEADNMGTDKLADKKLLGSLLHAMDMLSDRYYWVHAYARIATNFGLKAEIPFNPYKDQTSKDAALQIYAQITGKVQSSKKMEDKINKENNVFVPPVEDHGQPDFEFNQPKDKDNVTKPSQMK